MPEVEARRQVGIDARSGTILRSSALVDSFGTGSYLAVSVIYFVNDVGISAGQLGLGLTIGALAGLLVMRPIGLWSDKVGPRRFLVALLVIRAVGFSILSAASGFPVYLLGCVVVGIGEKPTAPMQQLLIAEVAGAEGRQKFLAQVRTIRNVGFGLGALAAASALSWNSIPLRAIVVANAASFILTALAIRVVRSGEVDPGSDLRRLTNSPGAIRDSRYLAFAVVNALLSMHMVLLSTGIPLVATESSSVPEAAIPLVFLLNTVLAVVFQIPFTRFATDAASARRCMAAAAISLAICCSALAALDGTHDITIAVGLLLISIVSLTVGEILQSAGGWELSYVLAPPERRGEYVAIFSSGVAVQSVVAPVVVTALVVPRGTLGWALLGFAFACTALIVRLIRMRSARHAKQE